MRLLHTTRLQFDFFTGHFPEYVILSHTWDKSEVTFDDFENGTATTKDGWAKVASTCAKAAAEGYDWVWIDSCCIQKTSSSELQEAINSMWAWYQQSTVCYVYLTDVPTKSESHGQDFETSRWWKRGWTLQELLAPTSVEFYARDWSAIGTRSSRVEQISRITTIDEMVLRDGNYHSRIAAERMSWAAHRETTRPEDMAYCLLGLFNIST
jgi:hypothetical protein